jgi:Carboxypeptidase regulatory-like domain/TonB-dependent Receptor Plug Domain
MKVRLGLTVLVVLFSSIVFAQTFRGGIQGTVTDSSGAAIAQAQVKIVNAGTGLERTVVTDESGNYTATELPLGAYTVSAAKQGFSTSTLRGVQVAVSVNTRVDVKLSPGQVEQNVEVTAEVPIVDTTSNTLGGTIDAQEAAELPVNGRDFTKMLTLVAGANADPSSVNDAPGSFGIFTINGNRGRSNNYLLDGTDMNDGYRNDPAINEAGVFGTPATLLPIDAIAEMGILSNMEAEYGRNSGGVVNIVTKSGTNQVHGAGFEYFRNSAMDARNYFNAKPNPQNGFHNNQFGVSLGGPLIKDKTFWFTAWEGWREYGSLPAIASVPTQARINNFLAGGPGAVERGGTVTPTNTINPVIANLLATNPWGMPLPASGDDPTNPLSNATVQVADKFSNRVDSLIFKVDHHIGKDDLLTGRYFFGDSDQSFPFALGGGTTIPNYNTVTPTRVQVLSLSFTHIWTPKLVMEVRGGWNRFAEGFFPQDSNFNPASIGLNNGVGPQDYGLPLMIIKDGTSGLGATNSIPRHRFDSNWQYFTNFSYNSGKHNWKYGYEFRRTTVNQYYDLGYRSRLRFSTFEDFLSGTMTAGGLQFAGDSHRNTHQNNHGFYLQDNFRLTHNLTLNYGLRWDYYGVINESNNQLSILNTTTQTLQQVGTQGLSQLYPKDLNNFAPRAAIAWDVNGSGKTVVRAGWGLYYDAFSQDFFIGHFPFNTFSPGMAYNGIGPNPITQGSFTNTDSSGNGILVANQPVFSGFTPTTDVWTVDQKIRTPYVQNYNLNIERQLAGGLALQAGYVGSTGKKLFRFRDINQATDPVNLTGPYSPAGFTYVNQFESSAWSNYNALQLTLKLRNYHGMTSQVNYTWSHSLDNASDGEDYVPNASQPDNSYNPQAEKGNSNFDRRQSFTWDFNYQLPGFAAKSWWRGGWAVDGVLRLSTGQPYNLNSFESYNGTGEFFERPDVIGNPFAGVSTPGAILNLGAFAAPCDWDPTVGYCGGNYHFGNLPRNAFVGPNFKNFDFSLTKNFKFGERVSAQFRADFINIFNHPNFSNPLLPNFLVDLETNGLVAPLPGDPKCATAPYTGCRAVGQGFLPITATPDVGIGNPFLGGGGPRNIQLAVRFSF